MKQFLAVLSYELKGHFNNKVYKLSTLIISLILIIGLSVPSINNIIKGSNSTNNIEPDISSNQLLPNNENYLLVDQNSYLSEDLLKSFCNECQITSVVSQEIAEELLIEKDSEYAGAIIIISELEYKYIVNNQSFSLTSNSENQVQFVIETILNYQYQNTQFELLNIDFNKVQEIANTSIIGETIVLGKNAIDSYWSTYILLFALYTLVLLYGQNIAVSVASEKSNRAIEVLVTSASSSALIFGKVIAGAIAGITQFGIIVISSVVAYRFNQSAWNGALDMLFEIPGNVLLIFAVFGTLGYLLYSFIYGALGALVQKSEEVNSSTIPITILYLISFVATFQGFSNGGEGMLIKIASYVPFSSFMAMFIRTSIGSVSLIEIIISLLILIVTIGFIGFIAAKIYRMGTLMYGNKIKLHTILKQIMSKD